MKKFLVFSMMLLSFAVYEETAGAGLSGYLAGQNFKIANAKASEYISQMRQSDLVQISVQSERVKKRLIALARTEKELSLASQAIVDSTLPNEVGLLFKGRVGVTLESGLKYLNRTLFFGSVSLFFILMNVRNNAQPSPSITNFH